MSDNKKDIVEQALGATADAAKSIADGVFSVIGFITGASSSSDKPEITVTENPDGSKDVHIPKP